MKKKILILGSSGQIGSHLEKFFRKKKNYQVLKFDIVLGKAFDLRNFKNYNIEKYIKKVILFISLRLMLVVQDI